MRMIIKNKKTGKSYSVVTKDMKPSMKKDMMIRHGDLDDETFRSYYKGVIADVANRLGCKPEDIATNFSNIEVYHDPKYASDDTPDFPSGWCDKTRWEMFLKKHPEWSENQWNDHFPNLDEWELDIRMKPSMKKDSEEAKEKEEKIEDKKATLSDEEIEQVKELLSLLPDLKALVEDHSEKEESKEETEEEESEEEEVEEEVQDEDHDDVLLETEEDDDEYLDEDEEIVSEEDEEEIHDSKASIGAIEKSFTDSNVLDKELDVANTFDLRYKTQLKK